MTVQHMQIDTNNPGDVQAVMLYGIRAGLDYGVNSQQRAAQMWREVRAEREAVAVERLASEMSREMSKRFFLAGCFAFLGAALMFAAACYVRAYMGAT